MADDFKTQARKRKYADIHTHLRMHCLAPRQLRRLSSPSLALLTIAALSLSLCFAPMRAHIRWTVREFKFDAKAVEAGKEDLKKHESKRVKQKVNAHLQSHPHHHHRHRVSLFFFFLTARLTSSTIPPLH
jgi:hypothetical protein